MAVLSFRNNNILQLKWCLDEQIARKGIVLQVLLILKIFVLFHLG